MFQKNNYGFTLVEISMVMIIIGLLIGGTFGGLAMVENMKVNSTVQQIKKFEAAAINFKQTYNYYPGDLANPTSVLPNCPWPCDVSGNQDGKITSSGWNPWTGITSWNREESIFWNHLAGANMIEGIIPDGAATFGRNIPLSPFDTGYSLAHNGIAGVGTKGNLIVITNSGNLGGTTADDLVLPGSAAQKLDTKMDDGDPTVGKFMSWNASPPVTTYDINGNYGSRYLYNF
jgi:prepilin-type N-terminal cleavage/methylation domain-containing protein